MNLMDILGITIAFITLILLMSILVTALVQSAQGLLRLRGRNLMQGLASLLLNARFPNNNQAPSAAEVKRAKKDAMALLNTKALAVGYRIMQGHWLTGPDTTLRYWLGPRVSWIEKPEQLAEALSEARTQIARTADAATAADVQDFLKNFERLDPQLRKRFLMMTRAWSLAFAVVVAFLLQVSTPELLNRLSTDAEYRQRILANVDKETSYAGEALERLDYEKAASTALEELATEFPDSRARIEQASGVGANKVFIVDELEIALEGDPQKDAIVTRYETMLEEAAASSRNEARAALGRLAGYDIGIWQKGWDFYYGRDEPAFEDVPDMEVRTAAVRASAPYVRWRNWLGVMMTTILLSFGAPFWFEALKKVVGLRDALKDGSQTRQAGGPPGGAPPGNR